MTTDPTLAEGVLLPANVVAFLMGEAPLEGAWFGDRLGSRGPLWWRRYITEARRTPPADGDSTAPSIREEALERVLIALQRLLPIRVEDGPDYAEVYFADGVTHSTQAMTMNPDHWRDLSNTILALTKDEGK